MEIVERNLLKHCIRTMRRVQHALERTPCATLIESRAAMGKVDSLALDVLPETVLRRELLEKYDRHIVLVTEEKGEFNYEEVERAEIVAFADPTDRSQLFRSYVSIGRDELGRNATFGDLLESDVGLERWREACGDGDAADHPTLSGPCCALTVVKRGEILFSLALNYLTRELVVGSSEGLVCAPLRLRWREMRGKRFAVSFPEPGDRLSLVTHHEGHYEHYLEASALFENRYRLLELEPGGPLRVLHLSDRSPHPVGMVLSNGERIGEWIGWLAFCRYSKDLVAYSVYPGTVFARDDILMTPSPPYSILEVGPGGLSINYSKLRYLDNPSRYREMIVVCHNDNQLARSSIEATDARRIF